MLFHSTDISLGQLCLPTVKIRRAGKDVFRGSVARMTTKKAAVVVAAVEVLVPVAYVELQTVTSVC